MNHNYNLPRHQGEMGGQENKAVRMTGNFLNMKCRFYKNKFEDFKN